ncbi:unnamed protein product, partial [Effrenium voratum]
EFKNPKFRDLVEAYRQNLALLVQENCHLREELGLDLETPLDWESEDESEAPENGEVGEAPALLRSRSAPVNGSPSALEMEIRKSSSCGISRFQVQPQFLHTPLDTATEKQFKATLVQDLRRFAEAQNIGDQSEEPRETLYDWLVHALITFRLPMSPNAELPLAWDILGLLFIAYDVFAIPLQAFPLSEDGFIDAMGWITLCFWTADIAMSNMVGFFDGPRLVMQQYRITLRYLKTWFVLDCVVVIPDWFTRLAQDDSSDLLASLGRILRSARAVRVIRLLRLLKLQKMMNKIYDFIDSEYLFIVMDILRLLLFIVVLNHVIACLWYMVGFIGYENRTYNWLEYTGYTQVIQGGVLWQYLTALHWSLTQFTPAGMDVYARNVPERIMSVIVLGFAVIIFSSVLASVSASMTALRNLQGDAKKQFWLLRRYLRRKKVSVTSRVRIIKFLEHVTMIQARTVRVPDVKLLKRLSEPLKELVDYEIHKGTVKFYPFLDYLSNVLHSVVVKLCATAVQQVQFALQDCIFRSGDLAASMYFICSGRAKYVWPGSDSLQELWEGHSLAEACLWTHWSHRGVLVVAQQPTQLLLLSPTGFADVMRMSQCCYVLCRRFAFSFVALLNAGENMGGNSDLPWDSELITQLTVDAAEASGLSGIRPPPRVKKRRRSSLFSKRSE